MVAREVSGKPMRFHHQKQRPAPIARRRGQMGWLRLMLMVLYAFSLALPHPAEATGARGDLIEICGGENGTYFIRADDGEPVGPENPADQRNHGCDCGDCCGCCLPGAGRLAAVLPAGPIGGIHPAALRFWRAEFHPAPALARPVRYRPAVRGPPCFNLKESEYMLHENEAAQAAGRPYMACERSGRWI